MRQTFKEDESRWLRPHAVPRGLLKYYVLKLLSEKPAHGYELMETIEVRTGGAWRPGAGSIYPLLQYLLREGYIAEAKGGRGVNTLYKLTEKGQKKLDAAALALLGVARGLPAIKRIFFDMIEPRAHWEVCTEGFTSNFATLKEMLERNDDGLDRAEKITNLREVEFILERHLNFVRRTLNELQGDKGEDHRS